MNPTKFSIAAVVVNPDNSLEVLAVKRPPTDEVLPNVWGFPAITPVERELPELAVKRLGVEKLATDIESISFLGIKYTERTTYNLILMDIEAQLVGKYPSVATAITTGTKYVDQQWTSDYSIFTEAASKGSLCCQIFLESKGIAWN